MACRGEEQLAARRVEQSEHCRRDPVESKQAPAAPQGDDQFAGVVDLAEQHPRGAPELTDQGGGFPVMTGHVPDGKAGAAVRHANEVVKVPTNLQSPGGRQVSEGDRESRDVRKALRQETLLEDLRGLQGGFVAAGIVHNRGGVSGQALGKADVALLESAAHRDDCQRPEHTGLTHEGHGDLGAEM